MRNPGARFSSLMPRRSAAATQTTRSSLCSSASFDQRWTMLRSSCGGSVSDAFGLARAYASTHLERLSDNAVKSIETSSLHLDLISDLKRINSHLCSIAYPILESHGALSQTRLRKSQLVNEDES